MEKTCGDLPVSRGRETLESLYIIMSFKHVVGGWTLCMSKILSIVYVPKPTPYC